MANGQVSNILSKKDVFGMTEYSLLNAFSLSGRAIGNVPDNGKDYVHDKEETKVIYVFADQE